MTDPADTSQQRAAVDPEARDSLVHRTRVDTLIWVVGGIISTCGLLAIPPSADSAYPNLALAVYQGADPGAGGVSVTFADLTLVDLS